MFDLNASTIRFWESEFDVLRPRKGNSGNRLYTERDIRHLQVIYQLVKVKGFTLQGAKEAMRTKFDKLEENALTLRALLHAKDFLTDLDSKLAAKQKSFSSK